MTQNSIEAIGLSKSFRVSTDRRTSFKERMMRGRASRGGEFWALRDASFTVPRGSAMGLIGPNGSGKSTALKVLSGIYRPTSGQVRVNGTVSALLEVGAGFHPELTGRQNIRLNATILGFTSRQINAMMDEVIEFADIGEHLDAPIKHYSSGMYVRLGFAVAVMVRPEVLIVDEVIAVGDEEFQRKCYEYLHSLRKAGTSMLIVSHGLGQIVNLCDEAVWLEGGKVVECGPSRTVVRDYLDRVNEKEASRAPLYGRRASEVSAAAHGAPTDDVTVGAGSPRRLGSGEVLVDRIEILREGQEVAFLKPGDPATFRIHYRADVDIVSAVFGLGFVHESGVFTAGPNSESGGSWTLPSGTGYVDFEVESVILQPGAYSVTSAIVDGAHTYDYVERHADVLVRATDQVEPGLVRMPGTWSVTPSAVANRAAVSGHE